MELTHSHTVTDATGCTASLNQTHTFDYDTLDIQLSAPTYNCDSNKTSLHFDLHGNAPWTIQYTQNGTPITDQHLQQLL
jgi:hypothetical protein